MKEEKKEKFEEERKEIFSVSLHMRITPEQAKELANYFSTEELSTATGHGKYPNVKEISLWDANAIETIDILSKVFLKK